MLEQRAELVDTARGELARWMEQPMGDIAGEVGDPGDESVASLVADLDHAEASRRVAAVRDIDVALERIQKGEYGVCIDCGGEIDYERLAAFPTAKRDIACQQRYEKTYAHPETPTL
jgi:RNA polymerase-binding transcription factor DksA